jgi:hypothetical protein
VCSGGLVWFVVVFGWAGCQARAINPKSFERGKIYIYMCRLEEDEQWLARLTGNCYPSQGGGRRRRPDDSSTRRALENDGSAVDISIPEGKVNFMGNGRTGNDGGRREKTETGSQTRGDRS